MGRLVVAWWFDMRVVLERGGLLVHRFTPSRSVPLFTVKFATGHDNRQTDGKTTHPQRLGTLTRHRIRCHAVGAAYAVCPQAPASSRVRGNGLAGLLFV